MSRPNQKIGLDTRLNQTLSPLQIRFGNLLEMTPQQLDQEVAKAVIENPALETVDNPIPQSLTQDGDPFTETASDIIRGDYGNADEMPTTNQDPSWDWWDNSSYGERNQLGYDTADKDITLAEYLIHQLSEQKLSPEIMAVAEYIVGNIDDNGYLTRSLSRIYDDITIEQNVEMPYQWFERAYETVRALEPAGVCAVDLQDCLLLQLKRKNQKKDDIRLATTIIRDYFDMFAQMHFNELCLALKIDRQTLKGAVDRIKALNPKPGAQIGYSLNEEVSDRIIPEFIVEVDGGNITVNLTNQPPELAISPSFVLQAIAEDSPKFKKEDYIFIKRHNEEASEMIHLMEMRRTTLLKVISAIVELQRPFFLSNDKTKIRPMVLKDIEKLTKLDKSVVSRATKDKYLQTSTAVYPLKLFFSEAPTDSEDSIHAYLEALKELIENEDKQAPLSDEALQSKLAEKGFNIARRTVTKYRDNLGYPVARFRKQI